MEDGDAQVCSFCGQTQDQARALIAGPGVQVCDECIAFGTEFLADEVAEPSSDPGEPVVCSFCGTSTPATSVVASPGGVCICRACVQRARDSIDEQRSGPPDGP